jgi:hypothetical protein
MGSPDPLPAGLEIRFGSLNFQATGNSYLMRLTNREELRVRRRARSVPVVAARVAMTPTPASTDAVGPSAPRCHRRSSQRLRKARSERRFAARIISQRDALTGKTTAAPVGERSVSGPRFLIGLCGATTAYVASANASTATRRVHPGRHVPATRDSSASAGDESSQGSADELPPATSHRYSEWDFSSVPDPVMFQRFLDATDYWFGYSDDSSAGSYDPTRECCMVITNNQANAANTAEAGDGEVPIGLGTGPRLAAGPSAPPPSPPRGPTSMHSWPKRASLRPSSRKNTAQCGCFGPPSPEKPPRAANAHANWADRPVTASTPTSTSTIRARPRERARSSSLLRAMPTPLDARGAEPAPRGAGTHRTSGRPIGRKFGVSYPPAGKCAG